MIFSIKFHSLLTQAMKFRFEMKKLLFNFVEKSLILMKKNVTKRNESGYKPTFIIRRAFDENKISIFIVNKRLTSMK